MKVRHLKTENNIYHDHLTSERPSSFDRFLKSKSERASTSPFISLFPTNNALLLKNPYLFVLIHLRKGKESKNKLGINIPEICIFDARMPYDVLYSFEGDIKGIRTREAPKLREVYSFFKRRSEEEKVKRQEQGMACFEDEEFLIMSDQDLLIACQKHKNDPFFKKLQYLRNKLNLSGEVFEVAYNSEVDCRFAGYATQCFAGYKTEEEMLEKYGEVDYLRYCNEKITMFLNYEQNIRINKATFCYSKSECGRYFLTNVKGIDFHNLTSAIESRQRRIRMARDKILEITPEKYERYKSEESKPLVKEIKSEMDSELYKITGQLNLKSALREIIEEEKTRQAFRKLYPKRGQGVSELLATTNFATLRSSLGKVSKRTMLSKPSKFMRKCFNLERRVRATYSHLPL